MGLAAAKLLAEHGIDFQGFQLNSGVGGCGISMARARPCMRRRT
ncbi:hypothetical protein [Sulfitobacter sp.]